jgi:hypothetical protein
VGERPAGMGGTAFTLRQAGRQGNHPSAAARRAASTEVLDGSYGTIVSD